MLAIPAVLAVAVSIAVMPLAAQTALQAEVLFRFPVGGSVTAGPVIDGSRAWLGSDARTLYALRSEGVAIGRQKLDTGRLAFIVPDGFGRAAISDGAKGLRLVNQAGQDVWRIQFDSAPATPVFAPDGRLFVPVGDRLVCLAPNGRILWSVGLEDSPKSGVNVAVGPDGAVALAMSGGRLAVVSAYGVRGKLVELDAEITVIAGGNDGFAVGLADGKTARLATGPAGMWIQWFFQGGTDIVALVTQTDAVHVLDSGGTLSALDGSGALRWQVADAVPSPAGSGIGPGGASLSVWQNRVVVATRASVRSYSASGELYRTLTLTEARTMPVLAPDGHVLVGGADWILYAYRFERQLVPLAGPTMPELDVLSIISLAGEESFWATSSLEDSVRLKLADIEKRLKVGTMDADPRRDLLYLAAVATGQLRNDSAVDPGRPAPFDPVLRTMACGLLADAGLSMAVPVLATVMARDVEPSVRAAALLGIARIGLDPDGTVMAALAGLAADRPDGRLALAMTTAIPSLYRSQGAYDDAAGMLALVRVAAADVPRSIRLAAERALRELSAMSAGGADRLR